MNVKLHLRCMSNPNPLPHTSQYTSCLALPVRWVILRLFSARPWISIALVPPFSAWKHSESTWRWAATMAVESCCHPGSRGFTAHGEHGPVDRQPERWRDANTGTNKRNTQTEHLLVLDTPGWCLLYSSGTAVISQTVAQALPSVDHCRSSWELQFACKWFRIFAKYWSILKKIFHRQIR